MLSLEELIGQLNNIKSAVGSMSISGVNNAAVVVFVDKTCNDLIGKINEVIKQAQENQNGTEEQSKPEITIEPVDDSAPQFELVIPEGDGQ